MSFDQNIRFIERTCACSFKFYVPEYVCTGSFWQKTIFCPFCGKGNLRGESASREATIAGLRGTVTRLQRQLAETKGKAGK